MWNRSDLKSKAKRTLSGMYWRGFLVSLAAAFLSGNINFMYSNNQTVSISDNLILPIALIMLGLLAVSILISVFIGMPFGVGANSFFLKASRGNTDIKEVIFPFNYEYANILKTTFLKNLFITLWSLLFIVPGIVKRYEYYMVEFILAENPSMNYKRAMELSRNMMYGHKWKTFVFDLSFIGWILLGTMAFGIGNLFVLPYINAATAELYRYLRFRAIQNGLTTSEELGGIVEMLNVQEY